MRRVGRTLATLALFPALLSGCVTLTQTELEQELRQAGRAVPGLGDDFLLFPIHADSKVAAWTLLAEARSGEGSPMAQQLAYDFERAERRSMKIVVGGAYPALTREIVLEALERNPDSDLSRLTLVVVGAGDYTDELRRAARAQRIRFYQRSLSR